MFLTHGTVNQAFWKGGVSQSSPGTKEQSGLRAENETKEWKWLRMWDWNFSPGVPATDADRARSLSLAAETVGPPWPEARTPEVAMGAQTDWWTTDDGAPPAAGSPASPGVSREPTETVPIFPNFTATAFLLTMC
jgi:hypothetical protein